MEFKSVRLFMVVLLMSLSVISIVSAGEKFGINIMVVDADEEKNVSVNMEEVSRDSEKIGLKTGFVSLDSENETEVDIMPIIIIICLLIVIYIISKQRITRK